jgi:flagellar protein FliS
MIGAKRYAVTQKETASKERLMVLLFEAALRHIRHGAKALEAGRHQDALVPLSKATDIVAELTATLDHARAPQLCRQLTDIYIFVTDRLLSATSTRNPALAREAERAFAPITDAFVTAVASMQGAPR